MSNLADTSGAGRVFFGELVDFLVERVPGSLTLGQRRAQIIGWPTERPRMSDVGSTAEEPMVCLTLRWRKTDSNSRSRREGKGYGKPLRASIAVSDLNLQVAPLFVQPCPIGNAQKSVSQERDRWFGAGSLQR